MGNLIKRLALNSLFVFLAGCTGGAGLQPSAETNTETDASIPAPTCSILLSTDNVLAGNSVQARLIVQGNALLAFLNGEPVKERVYPTSASYPITVAVPGGCYNVNHTSGSFKSCMKEFNLTSLPGITAAALANRTIRFNYNWWGYSGMGSDYPAGALDNVNAPAKGCGVNVTAGVTTSSGGKLYFHDDLKVTGGSAANIDITSINNALFFRDYSSPLNNDKYVFHGVDYDPANNHRVKLTNAARYWGGYSSDTCATCISNIHVTIEQRRTLCA